MPQARLTLRECALSTLIWGLMRLGPSQKTESQALITTGGGSDADGNQRAPFLSCVRDRAWLIAPPPTPLFFNDSALWIVTIFSLDRTHYNGHRKRDKNVNDLTYILLPLRRISYGILVTGGQPVGYSA